VDIGQDDTRSAGAISFGDARLLALPIRSYRGTFSWVTSPLLLRLAKRDTGWDLGIPTINKVNGIGVTSSSVLHANKHVFLEEVECPVQDGAAPLVDAWANAIASSLFPGDGAWFEQRLAVVHDETMTYLWECCTQVDARVRLNEDGVVAKGALWYEESLPAETLLLGVAVVTSRPNRNTADATLLDVCFGQETNGLQFGGKSTVGRGRARLVPLTQTPPNRQE
jgi:CRISPR-associated protein Cmr4